MVKVMRGYHNHPRAETIIGLSYANMLNSEEKTVLDDLTINMAKPRSILLT
ncbi:hypothetical protein L6164_008617 [Bauhinia variegata]|uniref:Uncharacterized protein n=1 Tax=Bauhinia variegata TaxID=167791 RepID=A0ACB9PH94_BAUVA|nr:hypothetical protein L6164_008617 [Bauhinia variegata]